MPSGPASPGQHADQEEHQQQRRAEAQRDQARQDAGQDQKRRKQNADADCVERGHCAEISLSRKICYRTDRATPNRTMRIGAALWRYAGATGGLGSGDADPVAGGAAGGIAAIIALAISCSPMTTAVAPCFFRCSISASEWARATIGSDRVARRAPARRSGRPRRRPGTATSTQRAASRLAARMTSGSAPLPAIVSGPLPLIAVHPVDVLLDHQERRAGLEQLLADEAADAAVADEHDMVGQRRERDLLPRRLSAGAAGAASGAAGLVGVTPRQDAVEPGEEQRIEQDRDDRAGEDEIAPALGQQRQRHAEPGEDEGELADLREARRDRERGRMRMPERPHDRVGGDRLAEHDDEHRRENGDRLAHDDHRIDQHADRDEEQHREGVAQRQRLVGGALAQLGFAHDHAGEEGAERERDVEQHRSPERAAERDREHRQPEQFARAGMGDVVQEPRDHALADDQHDRDEGRDLADGDQQRERQRRPVECGGRAALERRRKRRQHHQREDHGDVLDDQPADRDAPALGLEQPALLQGAQQHDRARHRQRKSEDDARAHRPAEPPRHAHAQAASRPRSGRSRREWRSPGPTGGP